MARYGKFLTNKTENVEEIIVTSDGGEYTDAVLRSLNFYPIETVGDADCTNRSVKYTLINDENGGHIEERYTAIIPPDVPKSYSKVKILLAAQQNGMIEDLIRFLESNQTAKYIWDASNVIEDNELLGQYLESVGIALGKTEEEIMAFLNTYCLID